MICLSQHQTIANKCAIPNAQSNRDWLSYKQYLYLMWLDHEHHRNTTTMCKTTDQARVLWYLTPLAQSCCLRVLIATWTALERHWKDLRHLFLVFTPRSHKCFAWQRKARNLAYTLLTLLDSYYYEERVKKVVSDSPGLVDFAIGPLIFVLNRYNGKVLFLEKFKLQKDCNQSC